MKKNIIFLLKIAFSLSLLGWFISHNDVHALFRQFLSLSPFILIISILIDLLEVVIDTWQWQVIIPQHSFINLLKANFVSKYYGLVLPGQIAGEVGKVLYLRKLGEKSTEDIIASVAVDKVTGLVGGVFFLGAIGAFGASFELPAYLSWLFVLGFVGSVALFFISRHNALNRLNAFVRNVTFRQAVYATAIGALYQMISVITVMIIAAGLGITIGFFDWCWILALLSVILLVPVSFGGLGIREASLVGLLSLFSVSAPAALTVSLCLFALQAILAAVGFFLTFQFHEKTSL
jgi:uncharacterized membrane protein YbhN (UPF0104 family)